MRIIRRLSIKVKIVVIAMACTLCALLTSVLFSDYYESKKGQQRLTEELTAIGRIIADRSIAAMEFDDDLLAEQNLATLASIDNLELACLYNQASLFAIYQRSNTKLSCPIAAPEQPSRINSSYIIINQPIILDDTEIGRLLIIASQTQLNELLAFYFAISLGFSGIGAIIALLLASRLQNVITNPIRDLQKAAYTVQREKNYAIRAEKQSEDEIGSLVDSFNDMLARIELDNNMLSESEHRFRTLTAASPFGIFQTNINGQFYYVNNRWKEITEINTENIDLNTFKQVLHPGDREEFIRAWEEAQELETELKAEFRLLTVTGKDVYVICQAKPTFSNENELTGFLGSFADISELKKAQSQLEKMALYDPLTELANRHLFINRLEKTIRSAKRQSKKFALMFLDFDQFKRINDTMGHDQGDQLLISMAKRLRDCIRAGDTVARMGGDEFTILIPDISERHEVDHIAQKILANLKTPILLMGHEITMTCSIGITVYPDDGASANQLMKNADMAMYKSKGLGRDGFSYFSEEINQQVKKHIKIESELRQAIKQQEFELYYQPKIVLSTEEVVGYEALIRWVHPEHGVWTPNHFIPVAEDTGLIIPIGEWVFDEACRSIKKMLHDGLLPPNGKVAINLSVKQFRASNLVQSIESSLQKHAVSANQLEIEITESLLMEDINKAVTILATLRELGITLSIDDFGTGYSSFSYLKRLPIDLIKVDRSFVMDIPKDKEDMEITSAVIAMAHKLGLSVVAEGVETTSQKEFLKANHCNYAQGYLFGKPEPYNKLSIIEQHGNLREG